MEQTTYKVFRKLKSNPIAVCFKEYDSNTNDYFGFLERNLKEENEQLILTTDIILSIMEIYYRNYCYDITEINFFENCNIDEELINVSLKQNNDENKFLEFVKIFGVLRNENNIDICNLQLDKDSIDSKIIIKSNGQVIIGSPNINTIVQELAEVIESIING